MTTYSTYTAKSTSEKITLCWLEPYERLLIWTLHSGAVYKRTTDYFVVDILNSTTSLTEGSSASLSAGQWWYDSSTGICYVRMSDDSNPNTKDIVAKYRLFYSTTPLDLPYDLSTGADVHYEGLLDGFSPIVKSLDDEQVGIALESNTTIKLNNGSGIFDSMYDTLFFENKDVKLYSWNEDILLSEKQLLFSGIIQDKSFNENEISFKCKDFVYQLRQPLLLTNFSTSDGDIQESHLNTPKRRIYGKVDQVQCVGIDCILDGYTLTGTISVTLDSATLTGSGTSFLDETSPGDRIKITVSGVDYELDIDTVDTDTQITLTDTVATDASGVTATLSPERPWRKKNRNWHIAGHKLRAPSTTVASAESANRITAADATDIFDSDVIYVDGESVTVNRVIGNDIVLEQNLQGGKPSVSDTITKNPISKAYFGFNEIFVTRDWTVTNTTESILNLTNTVERDLAPIKTMGGTITFTNGSRQVTATGIDLVNEVETRDWIRSSDINHTTWYEVLSVAEGEIYLRTAYGGTLKADTAAEKKNVNLINDESIITVNCMGMESSSAWIKTASDAVKYMVENDASVTNTNAASFTESDIDAPYALSIVIPETIGGETPMVRDVITKINESVFGSLINNSSWELVYNILTPNRPTDLSVIEDHDIVGSISVDSRNQIIRKVNAYYRPFADRIDGSLSYKLYQYTNTFVDTYIGAKEEKDVYLYLYEAADAQEMAERYGVYNSLSRSIVSIKAKLNMATKNLNDKVYLSLDRLYKRYGNRDRRKIAMISSIKKSGEDTDLSLNDLGNIFNRIPAVADNSSSDFTSADNDEKIINGYVLDNDLEIPDTSDDTQLGTGLIG